jgi:hypothetical protein
MNAYEKLEKLTGKDFKLITGVTKEVFAKMLKVLKQKYAEEHAQGGRPGLPVELRPALALEYRREYRTYRHTANDHQVGKTKINRAVLRVGNVLGASEEFKLKDIRERFKHGEGEEAEIKALPTDVGEQPAERPKYNQKDAYSGKKNDIR